MLREARDQTGHEGVKKISISQLPGIEPGSSRVVVEVGEIGEIWNIEALDGMIFL